MSTFNLVEINGDLFTSRDSLCHCVSQDFRMGKGIALHFKNRFGHVYDLLNQAPSVGQIGLLYRPMEERYIYYLVTKPTYYSKPTYGSLKDTLIEMKNHMLSNNVTRLSMPKIGCGLDRLEWNEVKDIIKQVFAETNITITVYLL